MEEKKTGHRIVIEKKRIKLCKRKREFVEKEREKKREGTMS